MAAGLSLGNTRPWSLQGPSALPTGCAWSDAADRRCKQAADKTPSGMVSLLLLDREKVESIAAGPRRQAKSRSPITSARATWSFRARRRPARRPRSWPTSKEGRAVPLTVAGAFHTRIDETGGRASGRGAARESKSGLRAVPVISNVDAKPHDDPEEIRAEPGAAGCEPRFVGRLDAVDDRFAGNRRVLRGRPGARAARPLEADGSQGGLPDCQTILP